MLALCIQGNLLTADAFIVTTAFFCAVPVIVSSFGRNRARIWKASEVSWKTLAVYGVVAIVAADLTGFAYNGIYALIAHVPLPSQPTQALISKAKDGSVWLSVATVAIALPVAEEILFRGYLFEALRRRFSGMTVVILTGAAFSIIHFQLLYFVPLFGFGFALGWIRLRTHSMRLTVLLHVFNNGLFLILAS